MRPSAGMSGAAAYADRMIARDRDQAAADTIEILVNEWLDHQNPVRLNSGEVKALLHAVERLRSPT